MAPSQLVIVLLLASHSRILAFVCIPTYERYFGSQTKPPRAPLHASSSDSSSEPSQNLNVRVYDNVFSSEACDIIHGLAIDHQYRATNSDGSSIFYRPPEDGVTLTPLELAIDSTLAALNDTSRVVEYWSREEYLNIDAHADVDEGALEDEGEIRCPTFGHVLYLQADKSVRGPTFVFDKMEGWERGERHDNGRASNTEMVTVPCVPGRVLRFDGRAMHAVPKPFDRYLLSDKEEKVLREEEAELYGDEDDDELRSVLLFNTWSDGPPPRFVDADYFSGALPLGIEIEVTADDDENDGATNIICDEYSVMVVEKDGGGNDDVQMRCNSVQEWEDVAINTIVPSSEGAKCGGEDDTSVNINLMGNKQRRCHPKRRAAMQLPLPSQTFIEAVSDARQPSRFVLSDGRL